jgi:creatinine amidohydrolase
VKTHRMILTIVSLVLLASMLIAQQRGPAPAPGQAAGQAVGARGGAQAGRGGGGRGGNQTPDTVFIEEMTWEEVRDAIQAGKTSVIIPTGGTEKNGYHMVLGKHNYVITFNANKMARRLGNALVAPTVQYVPEGDPNTQDGGEFSHPSPGYDRLLEAAARSLKVHGFKEILFIGDSGGNQAGFTTVATKLNEEWKGTDVKVFPLTDYYNVGRDNYRAYLMAAFGYDDQTVGSHAGISDTSQMLFLRPSGIRLDQLKPFGGARDSGVSGDPTKATADIGKMGVEFKVNAAINQYRALKAPAGGRGGRGTGGGGGY